MYRQKINYKTKKNLTLLLFCTPALLFFLVFNYLPMFGTIVAFKDFDVSKGILRSPWNGLDNFRFLFMTTDAWRITRNTLAYNAVFIVLDLLVSLTIAISLDSLNSRKLVKLFQTVNFFPHFISWVVAGYMLYAFLQPQYGLINKFLSNFGIDKVSWYMEAKYWIFILPIAYIWKHAGYSSILYYSALINIDREYYEAAEIDGASRWKIIINIKIPMLSSLIIMMVLLAIGKIFYADFGMFYNLPRNVGILYRTTDVIDTYVYRSLKISGDIGMGSAAGLYQSIIGFLLVITTNTIVKKLDQDKALF